MIQLMLDSASKVDIEHLSFRENLRLLWMPAWDYLMDHPDECKFYVRYYYSVHFEKDAIGEFMEVKDVKGIFLADTLYNGAAFARLVNSGELGTAQAPTEIGNEFIWSLMDRLDISVQEARDLIRQAYLTGQISYTNENTYSNYASWYADADGKYLGFAPSSNVPSNAVYIMKSYGYLGYGDIVSEESIEGSDLMYMIVRVQEEIATGLEIIEDSIDNNGVLAKDGTIKWTVDKVDGVSAEGEPGTYTVSFKVKVPEVKVNTTWKNVGTVVYKDPSENPEDPDNPDNPKKEVPSNPVEFTGEGIPPILDTCDYNNTTLWIAVMALAATDFVGLNFKRKEE